MGGKMVEVVSHWRGTLKEGGSSPVGVPKVDSAFTLQMVVATE